MRKHILAAALALSFAGACGAALAQAQSDSTPPYGPGFGRGPGFGPGPGMMGGWGGAGPGMMGRGFGGGPGAGYGPGRGFGPGGVSALPGLTDDQRDKIAKVQEQTRQKNWATMGEMRSEQFKLRQLYFTQPVDANAVAEQQKKVDELRRVMLASRVQAHNEVQGILTPEQRQQFRGFGPRW